MTARSVIAIVLTLLTGLVLGQILTPSLDVRPNPSARERSSQVAAVAFYEAVNRYLESGDPSALEDILDPGFVDHSGNGGDPDAAGFLRYLAAMRATYPEMRVDATSITPQGDLVAVALATTGGTTTVSGGLVPDRLSSAPGYEQLRIVDGKVTERWASGTLPPQVELVASVDVLFRGGWFIECAMERLTLEPGASETLRQFSHSLLITGSQPLAIEVDPHDAPAPPLLSADGAISQTPLERGVSVELAGDSVVQFPEGESYRVWNSGEEPATAIVVEIQYRSPALSLNNGYSARVDPTIDDARESPAGLLPMESSPDRPYVLSLVRLAAAPNEVLPLHAVNGIEQLLVAEGTLEVEPFSGIVSIFGPGGRKTVAPGDQRALSPGEGITASGEALLSYRIAGDGPATLWFVTLIPIATA